MQGSVGSCGGVPASAATVLKPPIQREGKEEVSRSKPPMLSYCLTGSDNWFSLRPCGCHHQGMRNTKSRAGPDRGWAELKGRAVYSSKEAQQGSQEGVPPDGRRPIYHTNVHMLAASMSLGLLLTQKGGAFSQSYGWYQLKCCLWEAPVSHG